SVFGAPKCADILHFAPDALEVSADAGDFDLTADEAARDIFEKIRTLYNTPNKVRTDVDVIAIYKESVDETYKAISQFLQDKTKYPDFALKSSTAARATDRHDEFMLKLIRLSRITSLEKNFLNKLLTLFNGYRQKKIAQLQEEIQFQHGDLNQELEKIS